MKKGILLLTGFLVFVLIFNKCSKDDNCHQDIYVLNNTSRFIYIYNGFYPDTSIRISNPFPGNQHLKTKPYSKNSISTRYCYDRIMQYLDSDTISVFIFDAQIVETVTWDTIRKNYMILKRYDLSYPDLVRLNWQITYP